MRRKFRTKNRTLQRKTASSNLPSANIQNGYERRPQREN